MERQRRTIVGLLIVGILAGGALGHRSTQAASSAAPARETVQVTIQNFAFSPQTITVAPGTTVTWTQKDSAPHTVTSDTNAWTASAELSAGQTFSHTFTTAGTFPYHCAVHPNMTATVIVAGSSGANPVPSATPVPVASATPVANSTPRASATPTMGGMMPGNMGSMGKASAISLGAWTGYYDGKTLTYISTDTSSKTEAAREHINYSASLAKTLPQASKIYFVTNGAYAGRGAIFGSALGEDDYTPLWQEMQVSWKVAGDAVLLTSDNQINNLVAKGTLRLKGTGVVLNCPIIAKPAMVMHDKSGSQGGSSY